MKTIIFDETSSVYNPIDQSSNQWFLDMQIAYLKDMCYYREHLYLNEVCDALGIARVPHEENACYRENEGGINFKIEPREDGTYLIHIN